MSYIDDLNYQTLLLLSAAHVDDEAAAAAAYEAVWDSEVDPIHIAMNMAQLLKQWVSTEMLEQMLPVAAAAAAAGFADEGELKYPSPRGKIRKPRGRTHLPPKDD
ncbi:hypothetical protein [Microbacterium oxydans]|uniref:hypothetical protein n=1 Tax=Microbacterium oxydans TaxID=82380 RepID=UPI000F8FAABE|nr:hypothetical protein [Microbacterium oxydans]AZS48388.1 hypothetical protein CVS53_03108 [Microbacterium oxydans]